MIGDNNYSLIKILFCLLSIMSSVQSELGFWDKLKSSFISTRNEEREKSSVEGNTYLVNSFATTGAEQDSAYGNAQTVSNKDISTLRYVTDVEHNPYSLVNINPGIPDKIIDSDSKSKYGGCKVSYRDNERNISFPVTPGFKGWGSTGGDIDISSSLRNNEDTNIHRALKPEINNYTDFTFQPFDKDLEAMFKPFGPNGSQDYVRGGDVSRL
jgi:hypothetical protein